MSNALHNSLIIRGGCSAALFFLTFTCSWPVSVIFLLLAIFYFDRYIEALLIVLVYLSVYGDWHAPARSLLILAVTGLLVFLFPIAKRRFRIDL